MSAAGQIELPGGKCRRKGHRRLHLIDYRRTRAPATEPFRPLALVAAV